MQAVAGFPAEELEAHDAEELEEQVSAALDAALQPLSRLTTLALYNFVTLGALPALASLPRLQQLYLVGCGALESLPPGPWCSSLRTAAASWDCLRCSGEFLAAAAQLLCIFALGAARTADSPLLEWAAAHAPLRQLHLQLEGEVPGPLVGALLHLQQARPGLEVRQGTAPDYYSFGGHHI